MTTTIEKRISAVRKVLKKARLEALLVPTGDPHMSEYLPENWAFRRWLTGFDSAEDSVRATVEQIVSHPLMPDGLVVRGFLMDPATGRLDPVS